MKKKLFGIAIIITIIGIIIVALKGYNVNLRYRSHQSITVPINKEYNIKDIQSIADEVFGKNKSYIEKADQYKETAIINVKDVSDEQIETVKNKINEKYGIQQKIRISIGEDYNVDDIKTIANEVFGQEDTNVQKYLEDEKYVEIDSKLISENELELLNNKINEKYTLTNTTSSISVAQVVKNTEIPRVRLLDMAKQYVLYTVISIILVLIYFVLRYNKLGIIKVIVRSVLSLGLAEVLYMSIIVITRYPVDKIAYIAAMAIYMIVVTYLNIIFNKESEQK